MQGTQVWVGELFVPGPQASVPPCGGKSSFSGSAPSPILRWFESSFLRVSTFNSSRAFLFLTLPLQSFGGW